MAINDDQGAGNAQAFQAAAMATPFASFHQGGLAFAPISRGIGSESYTTLKKHLTEYFSQTNKDVKVALIDLDNTNNSTLKYSALIVALMLKDRQEIGAAYHVILLAGTGDELTPVTENIGNQNIEILRVPGDAIDAVLLKEAQKKVEATFPDARETIFVDATVLPASYNPEDKIAVHRLALNAGLACATELQVRSPGFADLNLAGLNKDSTLNINLNFGHIQHENSVGEPVRSDVRVALVSKKNNQNNRTASLNSGDKEVRVAQASGFIDVVYSPSNEFNGYNPMVQPSMQNGMFNLAMTRKYAARLVLTDIASEYAYTPATVLLSLAAAMTAGQSNNWFQAFRPTPANGKVDLSDIGALNIEANLQNEPGFGTRINTKSEEFKLGDLGTLLNTLFKPGLMLAIDCPEGGPQSWYLSVFSAASRGVQAAYDQICNAANQLTNGNFSRYFPSGTPMFVDPDNRIHMGYYTDRSGQKRDIRDFDHLAVCNLQGETNPTAIGDFSDTYLRTEFPLVQRMYHRKRMIQSLSGETAVFTGMANRVTFSGAFVKAFSQAILETGLAARVITPLSSGDFNTQRGTAGFADSGLMAPAMVFNQASAFNGYNPMGNTMYGSNFRWG